MTNLRVLMDAIKRGQISVEEANQYLEIEKVLALWREYKRQEEALEMVRKVAEALPRGEQICECAKNAALT